ncbi:MAG: glycoside hydrolase family 127 protein [Opitutae bacterium]|nr:glycoside hydrolase family 127 protein [Opitutae bacterium]
MLPRFKPIGWFAGSCIIALAAAHAAPISPAVPFAAPPLPLDAVRLTGGPLKHAQDLDCAYLLRLDPDRLLYFLRQRAGLVPKAPRGNSGWDGGDGKQLTGHIAGHYLSAVSLMWAATGDARFKERADYLVRELAEIQAKQGDGYIGALTDAQGGPAKELFAQIGRGEIRSSGFDLNGLWSPWYVEHKLFAGLRDAYRRTGNRTALEVEVKFAEWGERTLAPLTDEQIQKMLAAEFGGMNEVAVDLYLDTGERRWLALAERFQHRAIVDPLARGEDILGSKHGNTQVPKLLGSLARYLATGNEADGRAARFFWEQVAWHHSFASGGHGKNEYFGPPDRLDAMIDGRTAETCNVYNMLKLTRTLMALRPDARYAEFHERALFNHILASIDPANGATCYMVPVGRGVTREYERDMLEGEFTCCVGTGMESHALHGDGLYHATRDRLWVNLFAPSLAEWREAGVQFELQTDFPDGETAKLTIRRVAGEARMRTISVRRPAWAGAGFRVRVNGAEIAALPTPGNYVDLARVWREGDAIELVLPKTLRLEPLPDNPRRAAILWGPLVLAGDLGPEGEDGKPGAASPVFVTDDRDAADWILPVPGEPGRFRSREHVGRDRDVTLVPLYRLHRRTYALYWDVFTETEWRTRAEHYRAVEEERRALEAATVAFVQPGEMQPETDFHFRSDGATIARVLDRAARRGGTWVSFDVPVDSAHASTLIVTFTNDERQPGSCDVWVDGAKIGHRAWVRRSPELDVKFEDVMCALPDALVAGKTKLTVSVRADAGRQLPAVVGLRVLRTDARR